MNSSYFILWGFLPTLQFKSLLNSTMITQQHYFWNQEKYPRDVEVIILRQPIFSNKLLKPCVIETALHG